MEEQLRKARTTVMESQDAWTRWTKTERKLKMGRNLVEGTHRIQFMLRSVYDLLPTLTNLYK